MNRDGVSLVRDRAPAATAQDEMGGPPFLMRKKPSTTPPLPASGSPGRTSVGTRDLCPTPPPPIHLHPSYSNSTCSFSSSGAILEVQGSSCLSIEATPACIQSGTRLTSSHVHQHSGQMKGPGDHRMKAETGEFLKNRSLVFL